MSNKQKMLALCGCGCGAESHWHRLHLLKGADGKSYHVLDECRAPFAEELKAFVIMQDLAAKLRHVAFWRRWPYARSWFACQYLMHARLRGVDAAARRARRDTMLFVLPLWVGAIVSRWGWGGRGETARAAGYISHKTYGTYMTDGTYGACANAFQTAQRVIGKGRVCVTRGRTCYHPETRTVNLAGKICFSCGIKDILAALHECAHAHQHEEHPVIFAFRNFWIVRWWLEEDAWRRAHILANGLGFGAAAKGTKMRAHASYAKPRVFVR